ncbi:Hsp20/alpha crystallin family protein [Roseburia sp. MSJ-14]|uniref:Hsp20/alpha crystallin family protein n=1 Tax=Roseburia sp. MSJ-14 TaxID=2841514 RepID=UPI001C100E74|nr:Hsp20/alpha crystallin family protein [Roseburia sp. MSJ-14]MBU5472960.1 Hsp20/alpha crystallin family protein [Roseburia sp. MSJ-14]
MLAPSIFGRNFVDDFFGNSFDDMFQEMFRTPYNQNETMGLMSTDVQDMGDYYQLEMELPGYQKEDLKADLKDGYLTISAEHKEENDEKDEKGKFVRQERYTGYCQRSFYVGENITQNDIKAGFENGVLKMAIPKKEAKAVEEKKYIAIE